MVRLPSFARPRKPSRSDARPERAFPIVAVIVVFGSLLGIVVVQTFIVQNRVRLDSVNSELTEARDLNQRLWLQVIELEAPERILETAVTDLGLVRPDERTYLPGVDPDLEIVPQPPPGDPFGPGPLPEFLTNRAAENSAPEETLVDEPAAEEPASEEPVEGEAQ